MSMEQLQEFEKQHQALIAKLDSIGFIGQGNIQWRWKVCGKPNCACRRDPASRHGPYPYWTTKQEKKTVNKRLHPDEAALLEQWIENRRTLEAVISEMKALAQRAFDTALKVYLQQASDHDHLSGN